jgi:site-specific DNA recombinase
MKTAAIYARVSTSGQAKDGTSLDTQADGCVAYAQAHGMTVATVYKDDVSGAQLDRPGLDSIRDMAERGEIQALIVFDPDRLSRNLGPPDAPYRGV